MPSFPILRTKAVAQYPASKSIQFRNQICRFVDGNEQRYRDSSGPLHRWTIQLNQLDETEMAAMEQFFLINQGRFGNFTFTDPWDGVSYPNCSLATDTLAVTWPQSMRGKTVLAVVENKAS